MKESKNIAREKGNTLLVSHREDMLEEIRKATREAIRRARLMK